MFIRENFPSLFMALQGMIETLHLVTLYVTTLFICYINEVYLQEFFLHCDLCFPSLNKTLYKTNTQLGQLIEIQEATFMITDQVKIF